MMSLIICHFFVMLLFIGNFAFWAFNIEELESRKYRVEISDLPIEKNKVTSDEFQMFLNSKSKQNFGCSFFPVAHTIPKAENFTANINADIDKFLQPMSRSCLFHVDGWWTYEFCYRLFVRQYHTKRTSSNIKLEIIPPIINLGFYDSDYNWNVKVNEEMSSNKNIQYHSQTYVNGTKCDITKKQRTSEVRFYCADIPYDNIFQVEEPNSCHYILSIYTSNLCSIPMFRPPPADEPEKIICRPVINEPSFPVSQEIKEDEHSIFQQHLKRDIEKLLFTVSQLKEDAFWAYLDEEMSTLKETAPPDRLTGYINFIKVSVLLWQSEMEKTYRRLYDKAKAAAESAKISSEVQILFAKMDEALESSDKNTPAGYQELMEGWKKSAITSSKTLKSLSSEQVQKLRSLIKGILMGHEEAILEYYRSQNNARNYEFSQKA